MKPNRLHVNLYLPAGVICLCLLFCTGCVGASGAPLSLFATPSPSPVPTPTPAPTPVPVIALFGAENAPDYAAQVERAVAEAGLEFESLANDEAALSHFSPEGAGSVIVYCSGALPELDTPPARYPVFVCSATRQTIPAGVSNLCYDDDMAEAEALQLALDYPPHLAPVRMLGLFTQEDSTAAEIWNKAVDDGLILPRGAFYPGEGDLAAEVNDWLTDALKKLYPGMLDCVYAETGALAVAAANAMLALSRSDAELFAATTDGGVCAYLEQHPALLAHAVGMDIEQAARISVESAVALLSSDTPIERSLTPQVFPATSDEPE